MRIDAILGKLIALTKQIMLREPHDGSGYVQQFFAGDGTKNLRPFHGTGMEWWYTESAFKLCDDIASMARRHDPALKRGDQKAFSTGIQNALTENALNSRLFSDHIIGRARTLFDARILRNEREFALCLWDVIRLSLSNMITNWIVLYPLTRINIPHSFYLGYEGISLIQANDAVAWDGLLTKCVEAKFWDPRSGSYDGERIFPSPDPHTTWLVCEIEGTQNGARYAVEQKMRTFLAVLTAHVCSLDQTFLYKSAADPNSYSIQFPLDSAKVNCGMSCASIGILLHSFPSRPNLAIDILNKVKSWYRLYFSANTDCFHRATKGAHFLNYGMITSGIEQFLHFYISLDALFGDYGRVEKGIQRGLSILFHGDIKWGEKAEKLFELRNELVHGSSSKIDEWGGFDHYKRHFRTDPLDDVGDAAMTALRNYFWL